MLLVTAMIYANTNQVMGIEPTWQIDDVKLYLTLAWPTDKAQSTEWPTKNLFHIP